MTRRRRLERVNSLFWALVAGALLCAACDDDPTSPPPEETWSLVVIEDAPALGGFQGLAFSGSNALAVGTASELPPSAASYTPLVAGPTVAGGWSRITLPALPSSGFLSAVGYAANGEAIIAGADLSSVPFVGGFLLDQRLGWNRLDVAVVGAAVAQSGATVRVAGAGSQSVLVSTMADTWVAEAVPFSPRVAAEHGLFDMAAANGLFAACGFDDGGDGSAAAPNSVLFVEHGSGWQRIDTPCGGCTDREFRAVAVQPDGALFLGGAITDFGGGAPDEYVAFLLGRSASGDWVELVLPQAGQLDRVNEILIASSGLYLACGMGQTTHLVRVPPGMGPVLDATLQDARVECLAEDPDGVVWAAGLRGSDPDRPVPALWKRKRP